MATYVLVHGAWHTGAELEPTAAPIRAAGHVVHTPTIAGNRPGDAKTAGLAEAIKSIVDYLASKNLEDVVLVGPQLCRHDHHRRRRSGPGAHSPSGLLERVRSQ